jgi:hypothetical protein
MITLMTMTMAISSWTTSEPDPNPYGLPKGPPWNVPTRHGAILAWAHLATGQPELPAPRNPARECR